MSPIWPSSGGIGNKKKGKLKKAVQLTQVFALLGKKDSAWKKNTMLLERNNLVYYMFSGKNAPTKIFQFKCVPEFLENNDLTPGALLVYVQRVEDGCDIYCEINEFCTVKKNPKNTSQAVCTFTCKS